MNGCGDRKNLLELELSNLPFGVSFHEERTIVLYRSNEDEIYATKNVCRHQGGQFVRSKSLNSQCLKCPNHNWVLDLKDMEYRNPAGGLKQNRLHVERTNEGRVLISESFIAQPWAFNPTYRSALQPGEMTLTFLAHASMEFKLGEKFLITDPWLTGPAFSRGWWLAHTPPCDWMDRLLRAHVIYISHNHSDHLNEHTLRELVAQKPSAPILVPDFPSRSCELSILRLGFTNVKVAKFDTWIPIDDFAHIMILKDATGRDDSGILVSYRGHRVLNTVDCANLNDGLLPKDIDVILSPFAGGASGFPVCWQDLYSEAKIREIVTRNRKLLLKKFIDEVRATEAKIAVPFAGYFAELHPSDSDIKEANTKNTQQDVCNALRSSLPEVYCWTPDAGETFDLSLNRVVVEAVPQYEKDDSYFSKYISEIDEVAVGGCLEELGRIRSYFRCTGFSGNLILHIIETDDTFSEIIREFMFDFESQELVNARPSRVHQYSRIKVRSSVFRYVLLKGLPWEEISIGFQARFYREPDVYEFDFWNHFQNYLPTDISSCFLLPHEKSSI